MLPSMVRLGAAVKYARYAAGLERPTVANRSCVSVDMIAKIEQGKKMPSASLLARLAFAMGTTSEDILERATATIF